MSKTLILFLFLVLCVSSTEAKDSLQIENLQKDVKSLQEDINSLQQANVRFQSQLQGVNDLKHSIERHNVKIDSLRSALSNVDNLLDRQSTNMNSIERKVDSNFAATDQKIEVSSNSLSESIQQRSVWGGGAIIIALILLALTFFILRKKINSGNSAIDKIKAAQNSLESAQKAMQEESVKLDSKLLELLEKQMIEYPQMQENNEIDHTLALKVADEIVKIEANLARMDSSIKGYKQLSKAVERIKDNFMANGYEIVDMLNKPYNEGMKASVSFETDELLQEGEQKITNIIKPQINYNGKMIQSAQITVSQNL
jgi:uncharacterized protein YoxC